MARSDRHKKTRTRIKPRFFVILLVLIVLTAGAIALLTGDGGLFSGRESGITGPEGTGETGDASGEAEEIPDEIIDLTILCAGDAMVHSTQWNAASNGDGTYDFTGPFAYIKSYVEEADLAIVNVETTFAGDAPSGYPSFCAPDEFSAALRWAGFDVANTVNNHTYDKRLKGVTRTLEILRGDGLMTVGTHYSWEKNYTVTEVNGVRIGIVSASYETKTGTELHALNGISISAADYPLINTFRGEDYGFSEEEYETDLSRIIGEMNEARADGAEIIICYLHWGKEYNLEPDETQLKMAQALADAGADIIFASHTHVPQPCAMLTAEDGSSVPVFYSLGNFVSNQRRETLSSQTNNIYTEEALLGRVYLTYNATDDVIEAVEMDAVPLWLDRWPGNGRQNYALIPLVSGFEENEVFASSGHKAYAVDALDKLRALVGEEYLYY